MLMLFRGLNLGSRNEERLPVKSSIVYSCNSSAKLGSKQIVSEKEPPWIEFGIEVLPNTVVKKSIISFDDERFVVSCVSTVSSITDTLGLCVGMISELFISDWSTVNSDSALKIASPLSDALASSA